MAKDHPSDNSDPGVRAESRKLDEAILERLEILAAEGTLFDPADQLTAEEKRMVERILNEGISRDGR